MILTLTHPSGQFDAALALSGSKSISNRALIIRALTPGGFAIERLASAKDTRLLQDLLHSDAPTLDAGAAGTTFRFLTAYLSLQPGVQTLTGSERMKQRPIGVLVEALRRLGAQIEYLGQEGYPPLRIGPPDHLGHVAALNISAGTSSQYISALLMIAPLLPGGLELTLEGKIVSRPYIEMTLRLMEYFGISWEWEGPTIRIGAQSYSPKPFTVEADWSAASYFYSMVALSDEGQVTLSGLFENSLQGDAILPEIFEPLGVYTHFSGASVSLTKAGQRRAPSFDWDFLRCPDLAQTLAVTCAGLGISGLFHGVETLRIKETDRIGALETELGKVGVQLEAFPAGNPDRFSLSGQAAWDTPPLFHTYEDHRMAMAFAPLALYRPIRIQDPQVVEKSYPGFWDDLQKLGFIVT